MKWSEAKSGRVFILRLEEGEVIHEEIEKFASDMGISSGYVLILGGAGKGSRVVVGPEDQEADRILPMEAVLENAYEVAGVGTLFPNSDGKIVLHLHASFGRDGKSITGCIRRGVKTWLVLEVIIHEIKSSGAVRLFDKKTGFEILEP